MRAVLISFIFIIAASSGFAATIYVPDQFSTIQGAIDASSNGDTIIVRTGAYPENIEFKGKAIGLRSEKGPAGTVIDGGQAGPVVSFIQGEGPDSSIEGFTITNGSGFEDDGDYLGGGIYCMGASPVISKNVIKQNIMSLGWSAGGGIFCDLYAAPRIIDNEIVENQAVDAAGVASYSSAPVIIGNTIRKNVSTSPAVIGAISLVIMENNLIIDNDGGGVACEESKLVVSGCTLSLNESDTGAGLFCDASSEAYVTDSIIWGNNSLMAPGIEVWIGTISEPSSLSIQYSDVKGGMSGFQVDSGCTLNWGSGMIAGDPLFFDPANNDFRLEQHPVQPGINNPCVDAGSDHVLILDLETLSTRTDGMPDAGMGDMGFHYRGGALTANPRELSPLTGSSATLKLDAGVANANRQYLIMAGLTGTMPGTPLPGGTVTLPLNWDAFTNMVLSLVNTPAFQNFTGTLDAEGKGEALFDTIGPLPPETVGLKFYFAYALNAPWDFVSNPVAVAVQVPEVWVDDGFNPSTPGWQVTHFDRVQDGIDQVAPGGVVHVEDGTYAENLVVNKALTLSGKNKNSTVIDGGGAGSVGFLIAEGITVSGFTFKNGAGDDDAAALAVHGDDCVISGNIFSDNNIGVFLVFVQNATVIANAFDKCGIVLLSDFLDDWNTHTISNNTANGLPIRYYKDVSGVTVPANTAQVILANCTSCTVQGLTMSNIDLPVLLGFSSNCLVQGNTISSVVVGVMLQHSEMNEIIGNDMDLILEDGIALYQSQNNDIKGKNTISALDDGIDLDISSYNNIYGENKIEFCGGDGINLEDNATHNRIYNNYFENNNAGVLLEDDCEFNEIYENDFSSNLIGIGIFDCRDNLIYHNNFYGSVWNHAYTFGGGSNQWDMGYPYPPNGGNHWDNWTSPDIYQGSNQNLPGSDGIVDIPYFISIGNEDGYPLVSPHPW